jgi:hypothetical protein
VSTEAKEPASLAGMLSAAETKAAETTTTPPETQPTETPAEETAPEPAEAVTDAEPDEPETSEDEAREYLLAVAQERGIKIDLSKYKTGEDAIAGLLQTAKKIGERDEDAEYGRNLRTAIGGKESEILALLQGSPEPKPASKDASKNAPPEFDPAWKYQIVQNDKGEWVSAPGAAPEIPGKYRKYLEWRERQLDDLARDPTRYFDELLQQKSQDIEKRAREAAAQETATYRTQVAIESWASQRAAKLFANGKDYGDGFSPFGQEVDKIQNELLAEGMTNVLARLSRAEEIAAARMTAGSNGKPTKRVPPKAIRQPAIAPKGAEKEKTPYQMLKEGKSLAEVVAIRNATRT